MGLPSYPSLLYALDRLKESCQPEPPPRDQYYECLHPGEEKKNTFLLACPRIAVKCPRLALPLNYWDVWFIFLPFPTPPLTSGGDWGVQVPAFALQPSFPGDSPSQALLHLDAEP